MKEKAVALMRKRDALVAQIAAERTSISQQGAALRPAALMLDKVGAGIRHIKSHPGALILPLAILTLWRPWRLLAFAGSGLWVWRLVQRGRYWIRR